MHLFVSYSYQSWLHNARQIVCVYAYVEYYYGSFVSHLVTDKKKLSWMPKWLCYNDYVIKMLDWWYNADDNSHDNTTSHTSVKMSYHTLYVMMVLVTVYSVMLIIAYSKKKYWS